MAGGSRKALSTMAFPPSSKSIVTNGAPRAYGVAKVASRKGGTPEVAFWLESTSPWYSAS